jgi:hypothetical protein
MGGDLLWREVLTIFSRLLQAKCTLGAYLDVLLRANPKAFKEAETMARRGLPTLKEALTEIGLLDIYEQVMEQGRREEKQNILNLLKSGKSAEEIIQLMENGTAGITMNS